MEITLKDKDGVEYTVDTDSGTVQRSDDDDSSLLAASAFCPPLAGLYLLEKLLDD